MKTGLLSLNIHDSLTFDGCELCLHQELFAVPSDVGVGVPGSAQQANSPATTVTRKASQDELNGTKSSATITGASTVSGNTTASSVHNGLSVGDIIEIRVWDPLPKEQAMLKSPGSVLVAASPAPSFRKSSHTRVSPTGPSAQYQSSTASVQVEFPTPSTTNVSTAINVLSNGGPAAMSSGTGGGTSLRPRTDALAVSMKDPLEEAAEDEAASVAASSTGGGTTTPNSGNNSIAAGKGDQASVAAESTASGDIDNGSVDPPPPAKTVAMTSSLPPVFPRARASTTDYPGAPVAAGASKAPNTTTTASILKPPTLHRRIPSAAGALTVSPKLTRGHTRQISDMTMDTHHLDIIEAGIQHMDSHDEDTADHGGDAWSKVSTTHKLRLSFVLLVTDKTLTSLKGNTRTQISMLRQVADLYSLSSYDMVTVHKIDPHDEDEVLKAVSADFVVMTIKDQFISRGDMHLFQQCLQGSWIYEGQRLTEKTRQIKAHALEIRHGNNAAKSGIVTEKTMITFRSRSARITWLVQLSSEMWDYSSPYAHKGTPETICEIYFDQWIRFLYKLFQKWKALEVTHSLTVIFFSRTFLSNGQKSPLNCKDVYGRSYEDHYKPVIENETCTEWESLIVRIKEEFVKYPLELRWNLTDRRPSNASQGNVLEAVNVTLNIMQFHFLDRDLYRTGNSIVVVSPGCGVFEVDKELAGITYQRMMDNGIGSDMLSLGLPPLHIAPFFLYNNEFRTVETQGVDTSETYYEVPHWMHLSFVSYDREEHQLGDHIHHEDLVSPTVKQDGLDSFELGPNGFLRPKADAIVAHHTGSPTFKSKSPSSTFSALGNKAATPGKAKSQQERQLISGRDFRDILEACRPRVSGMRLPSALISILKLHHFVEEQEKATSTGTPTASKWEFISDQNKHIPLREWGTVHFNEFPIRAKRKSPRSDSPTSRRSPIEPAMEMTDDSESGSNASSFMSHVSSLFGMSYDRVLWDHYESPLVSRSAFQIQRSPSLEFDNLNINLLTEGDSGVADDYVSVGTDKSSGGHASPGGGDADWNQADHDTATSQQSKQDKHIETLRKLMDAHDENVWAPISKKMTVMGDINVIRPESIHHVESEVTIASSRKGQAPSGGLGAALSQYSNATPKEGQPSTLLTRRASGSFLSNSGRNGGKERARAQSPLFPNMAQIQERNVMGISPMLLPSMLSLPNQHPNALDPPPSTFNLERGPGQVPHRSLGMDSQSSLSRENFGPLGFFSESNYERYLNPIGQPDGSRHLLRPIARSPPSSGIRLSSRNSPIGGSRGQQGMLATGSPPSSGAIRQLRPTRPSNKDVRAGSPPSGGIVHKKQPGRPTSPSSTGIRSKKLATRETSGTSGKQSLRQQKACNPFRQSDEDEVLAKRSHNRRRWSHVFPVGEVEFKRHSGPIWNSLTAPAILPLSVDYFPSPQELRDEGTFQFNPYTVTLGGIENKHYSSHADLMMEMVRQRVAQDFQIVTDAAVKESENRPEQPRLGRNKNKSRVSSGRRDPFVPSLPTIKHDTTGTIKHYLSMGHRIQILSYDPSSDTIEIVHYNRKSAHNDPINIYHYRFMVYSRVAQGYAQSVQTFKKYAEPYKWNKVDNLICGEEDRQLEVGMRFRRVMFGLIPEAFKDPGAEQEYVSRFQRLLEYLGKLREKDVAETPLNVKIVSSADAKVVVDDIFKVRRTTEDSMVKFTIPLRKGKRDPFEWMEIAVGSTFNTASSYRIMFNWLVASSAKVETQVQLLHRRCAQFGLQLISFPQTTISRDLFLHTFAVPTFFTLRSNELTEKMQEELKTMDFLDDGIRFTQGQVLDCIENSHEFDFPRYRNGKVRSIPSRQLVHRSGALFIRDIRDRQGWSILVGIENYRHASRENRFRETALEILRQVSNLVQSHSSDA